MGKRKLSDSEGEEEEIGEDDFLVEVITKARDTEDGDKEYLVKWWGYTSEEDSWEPYDHVKDCKRLLDSFWREVGEDKRHKRSTPGREYIASSKWIFRERQFFKKSLAKGHDEKDTPKRKEEEKDNSHKKNKSKKQNKVTSPSRKGLPNDGDLLGLFGDSSDDEPSISKKVATTPGKKILLDPGPSVARHPTVETTLEKTATPVHIDSSRSISSKPKVGLPAKNKFSNLKIRKNAPILSIDTRPTHADVAQPSAVTRPSPSSSNLHAPTLFRMHSPKIPIVPRPTGASEADVDNILATIASNTAALSQRPNRQTDGQAPDYTMASPRDNLPPQLRQPLRTGLKFERKWKWSGELFTSEKICNIEINDTLETSPNSFRLDIAFKDRDTVRLEKTYRKFAVHSILAAVSRVDQVGIISAKDELDQVNFTTVVKYMEHERLVSFIPFETVHGRVAEMIVFPSSMTDICNLLRLHITNLRSGALVIAILPWSSLPSRYKELKLTASKKRPPISQLGVDKSITPASDPRLSRKAVDMTKSMGVSEEFIKYMYGCDFCVWVEPVEKAPKDYGKIFIKPLREDTTMLLQFLSEIRAVNVGYKSDLGAVFVHVGAISMLRRLPAFVDRLLKRPDVRFYTYGWHEREHPRQWGIRQIFPIGGIVTVTQSAFYEDPVGVGQLLERISKHPLWDGFVLSSVLSTYLCSVSYQDPQVSFRENPFIFGNILQLISEGKVSLISGLPDTRRMSWENTCDAMSSWTEQQLLTLNREHVDIIDDCWTRYNADFRGISPEERKMAIEKDIKTTLAILQLQPSIQEKYRRFVVIKGTREKHIQPDHDGFEWRTVQEFDFRDEYISRLERITDSIGEMSMK